MTKAEKLFHDIAAEIPKAEEGKMFGALCFKAPNGKSAAMFWKDNIVVKLEVKDVSSALKLKGAKLFDPMGGRPMKEWVQIPFSHAKDWKPLAQKAMKYVIKK
jgi:hypothetical protein